MNPIEGFMGGFGQEVAKAVCDMLLPIIEPKLDSLVASITAQVKGDVQQLLTIAHADLGKALGDMGQALKADL
jgi:hypothetical protein